MQKKLSFAAVIVACFAFGLTAMADEAKLTCPVSGKPASKDHAAKYKEGQVYFCCDNCPKAFEASTKKFAAKANAQLVSTGQYKQVKCPLSGEDLNPATAVKIGDISVTFCCDKCKAKAEAAKEKKQFNMVFGDKAFAKAFEKAKDTK